MRKAKAKSIPRDLVPVIRHCLNARQAQLLRDALLTVVLLSPATLPWYFSWPLVLAAGFAWSGTGLAIGCGVSVWIMLSTYPAGSGGLYNFPYLALIAAVAALAALSLLRPDPLRLSGKLTRSGRFSRPAGSSLRAPLADRGVRNTPVVNGTPGD